MPSLNKNKKFVCLDCGNNCKLYTNSIEELTNHMKKKRYFGQHNDKLRVQQSQKTLSAQHSQRKDKINTFLIQKLLEKNYTVLSSLFSICHFFFQKF